MNTYLNGQLTVTSIAAPTAEDVAKIRALSDEEYAQFYDEMLDQARKSPVTDLSVDQIWDQALKEYKETHSEHAT